MGIFISLRRLLRFGTAVLFVAMVVGSSADGEELSVAGGTLDVEWSSPPGAALDGIAQKWIRNAAHAISSYYGDIPLGHAALAITLRTGSMARGGKTFGWNGAVMKIDLGILATDATLAEDWILPHEMCHLRFPNLNENHHWLEEGLATYIEPVARARVGFLTPARVWGDMVDGLPQGLPEAGDRGLDNTHTWARTYWGGALFCLRADVEIRRRTGNRLGLEHALRAILAAGGMVEHSWEIDRVIAVGDAATGTTVLRELYDEMKGAPVQVDLPALWRQLGVVKRGDVVTFDDSAPLANIRKAITGG